MAGAHKGTQSTTYTPATWAAAELKMLGVPGSAMSNDVSVLEGWEAAEGTYGEYQNPLDTTLREPGSVDKVYTGTPGVYVQGYVSGTQGLGATASTIKEYPGILADLMSGAAPSKTAADITGSPWGTGAITPGENSSNPAWNGGNGGLGIVPQSITPTSDPVTATPSASGGGLLAKVGAYLLGGALLLVGIVILTKGSGAGSDVEKGAMVAAA